jgi:hypothetical protein
VGVHRDVLVSLLGTQTDSPPDLPVVAILVSYFVHFHRLDSLMQKVPAGHRHGYAGCINGYET